MQENLEAVGIAVRELLSRELPALGNDWWNTGVISALSYQQRSTVLERGWTSLSDLDVAALLRVLDQNWELFRRRNLVSYEARNWLKEAISVRNRWAHGAPGSKPSAERAYRDLDTLALLVDAIAPGSVQAELLAAARSHALLQVMPRSADLGGTEEAAGPASPSGLCPGSTVRLKARPELVGVVTKVTESSPERRVTVFHGQGAPQTYFESQVELVDTAKAEHLNAEEMKARLTALHVLHPSVSRLYSLNTGRIDYEPYQYRPVMKLINADRPRLLIADDVGVGKTIEAALIIKELQARQKLESVLVICPKPLVVEDKWRSELKRFDEDFAHLNSETLRHCVDEMHAEGRWPSRYRKAILSYSLLDEKLLLGEATRHRRRPGLVSLTPPVKFDLVIVDEAHHVRNSETWSHRAVKYFLDSAEAAVLISATPIQTGSQDLQTLLRLLRPDVFSQPAAFDLMREPNGFLANVDTAIRVASDGWQRTALAELDEALATTWGRHVLLADPRAQELRDLLEQEQLSDADRVGCLRLTQTLNTFSGLINRTRRRDIGDFTTRKPETVEVSFTAEQKAVYDDLLDLASRINESRGRGQSIDFLLSTLKRQASSSLNGLGPFIDDLLSHKLSAEELSEADTDLDLLDTTPLNAFSDDIRQLAKRAKSLVSDPKLDAFLRLVDEKQELPNNKLLLFSTFRHTLRYLHQHLEARGKRVGLVHGGVPDFERREIRSRFAKRREEPDALDILLSSEVGTEGLDYQFCDALVNYDIPWNPMRIEQRIGRIDRRGQISETVAIRNMVVADTVDSVIYHRCLERIGVFRQSLGANEEILGELTRDIRRIGDDLRLSPSERAERLRQLTDNTIARIQEQQELEEREGALFGLTIKKLDQEGVEQVTSPWLAPEQLARLIRVYLRDRGYKRADALFERPLEVFRLSMDLRSNLATDIDPLLPASSSPWQRWLTNGSGDTRRLTLDPALADSDDIELLSPVHDFVRAAARAQHPFGPDSTVNLKVDTKLLPSGIYPLAVHTWNYLGLRDDLEVVVTSDTDEHSELIAKLLEAATDSETPRTSNEIENLEERHYLTWTNGRVAHIERTRLHIEKCLASLKTTHIARLQLLADHVANATHENIRRMRESERRSAEYDFETRFQRLAEQRDRSDITSTILFSGTLEVRDGGI